MLMSEEVFLQQPTISPFIVDGGLQWSLFFDVDHKGLCVATLCR
jgi:hypothetical protein